MNVIKKVLKNGLTILVRPVKNIPKVSIQLWYNVGSKDEQSNEKGIAHLIEHMIFKGTKKLSESDINLITHKLSGYCNAFTSYDYTGYLFDFPSQNWQHSLEILADCMNNCSFKEEFLNSELKAVIQELKMYRDDYGSTLVEKMLSNIFHGYPYQHPIIGYKQDLWNLTHESLVNFYKKHYVPNNATLVVVGDVNPEEVFELAEKEFGNIEPNLDYKKQEFIFEKDLYGSDTIVYRDLKQPMVALAFVMPGAKEQLDYTVDVLCNILAEGKGSRLYKKLVEEEKLVSEVGAFSYDLFDHEILFIQFEPNKIENIEKCIEIIKSEIEKLRTEGYTERELLKAQRKVEANFYNLLESNQKQAYAIGKYYLATQNENFVFNYIEKDQEKLKNNLNRLIQDYLEPTLMHTGKVLPTKERDLNLWQKIQKESDEIDNKILSKKERITPVEPGVYVEKIKQKEAQKFNFPKYEEFYLKNGLEILTYENKNIPKVDIIVDLKAKHFYNEIEGIANFVSEMLLEGTKNYSSSELHEILDTYGIEISTAPGFVHVSCLSKDLEKALELLNEILTNYQFKESEIEKVKTKVINQIKNYWDNPSYIADQLTKEQIYKGHPYSKNILGKIEDISKINTELLNDYASKFITPQDTKISIVGDFNNQNINNLVEKYFSNWQGEKINEILMPDLSSNYENKIYKINRDQVVLTFAGKSITRRDPDFDKALIFDQIYGGGALGSMSSKLFQIRERSGLFYTIAGSIISRADLQPGMNIVKTIVSIDRLNEAEKVIEEEMQKSYKTLTDQEIEQAKNALINSRVDNFASNKQIASSFLFLKKYNLPQDYFDKRNEQILNISKKEVEEVAEKLLTQPMFKLKVGRLN